MINNTLRKIALDFYSRGEVIHHKSHGKLCKTSIKKPDFTNILTHIIYNDYYCLHTQKGTGSIDPNFINALRNLHKENTYVDKGWLVETIQEDCTIRASKYGIYLFFSKHQYKLPQKELKISDSINVLFSCHQPNKSPGFYLYFGTSGPLNTKDISRYYFNFKDENSLVFCDALMTTLNKTNITFEFKILQDLKGSERVDNAVLYLKKSDDILVKNIVNNLYQEHFFNLKNSPFHYVIAKGIGYAHEPKQENTTESFGTHRSKIIAEAIYDELIVKSKKKMDTNAIITHFLRNNINVSTVYKEGIS